jgi:hypothetical protein
MKKLLLITALALVLKATGLLPFQSADIADLLPLRTLTVDVTADGIALDAGEASGTGPTLEAALKDLCATATGQAFPATVRQVILSQSARELLPEICRWQALRPAAQVVLAPEGLPDPEEAADYLETHDPGLTLQQVQAALLRGQTVTLPTLRTEGGLRLEKP